MKKSIFNTSLLLLVIVTLLSCSSENNLINTIPKLTTTTPSNISLSTASSGGNITSDGGEAVTARGIVWNTTTAPTTNLTTKTTDGSGTGIFYSAITNLNPSSNYFVRAYATNNQGTAYGNELSFTTGAIVLPTLSTTVITSITTNSAVSGGNIIADGWGTITGRGIVFDTKQNPTILLNTKTTDGTGTGNFVSIITNLKENTTYYIRSYATNSAGTVYGNQLEFKTNANPITVTDSEGNVYKTVQIGTQLWMAENLKTTKYCNGDAIPYISNSSQYLNTNGTYVYPDNSSNSNSIYGKLYNWYVAADSRNPCPCGWRVPTANDWIILGESLEGSWTWYGNEGNGQAEVGDKLKSIGTIEDGNGLWYKSNYPGTNSSGFNALPVGYASWSWNDLTNSLNFETINRGKEAYFWASTYVNDYGHYVVVSNFNQKLTKSNTNKYGIGSIRCLKK